MEDRIKWGNTLELIDRNKIKEATISQFDISYLEERMQRENIKIINRMLIDDIMDIRSGKYDSYDCYFKEKNKMIEEAEKMNKFKIVDFSTHFEFTYYVQPLIIDKDIFDFIKQKYGTGNMEKKGDKK